VIGRGCENTIEIFQRFRRTADLEQSDTAPVANLAVGRFEAKTFAVAFERPEEILQRVKDQAKARKAVGAIGIGLQCRLNERERCIETAMPVMDLAQPVECVKIIALMVQHRSVETRRLVEFILLMGRTARRNSRDAFTCRCRDRPLIG